MANQTPPTAYNAPKPEDGVETAESVQAELMPKQSVVAPSPSAADLMAPGADFMAADVLDLIDIKDQPVRHITAAEADAEFDASVDQAYTALIGLVERTVRLNLRLGAMACRYTDKRRSEHYGDHLIAKFLIALAAKGNIALKSSAIYTAMQMYRNLTRLRCEKALDLGVTYRNLRCITSNKITEDLQDEALARVEAGDMKQSEMSEFVKEKLGTPQRRSKAVDPLAIMDEVSEEFDKLIAKMERFGVSAAKLFRGDEDDVASATVALTGAEKQGQKAFKFWQSQLAVAKREQKKGDE